MRKRHPVFNPTETSEIPKGRWIKEFQTDLAKAVEAFEKARGTHVKNRFKQQFKYGSQEHS